jgi:hypothetical protein
MFLNAISLGIEDDKEKIVEEMHVAQMIQRDYNMRSKGPVNSGP